MSLKEQLASAAATAYADAEEHWNRMATDGRLSECLIESSNIFRGLDMAGLPPTDEMEQALEDTLMELGYYEKAAEEYKRRKAASELAV